MEKPKGWRHDSARHGLAAKGIKTKRAIPIPIPSDEEMAARQMADSVVPKINAIPVPPQDKRTHQAMSRAVHHVRDGKYDEALSELLIGTLHTGSVPTRTKIMAVFDEIKAYHTGQTAKWPRD